MECLPAVAMAYLCVYKKTQHEPENNTILKQKMSVYSRLLRRYNVSSDRKCYNLLSKRKVFFSTVSKIEVKCYLSIDVTDKNEENWDCQNRKLSNIPIKSNAIMIS